MVITTWTHQCVLTPATLRGISSVSRLRHLARLDLLGVREMVDYRPLGALAGLKELCLEGYFFEDVELLEEAVLGLATLPSIARLHFNILGSGSPWLYLHAIERCTVYFICLILADLQRNFQRFCNYRI